MLRISLILATGVAALRIKTETSTFGHRTEYAADQANEVVDRIEHLLENLKDGIESESQNAEKAHRKEMEESHRAIDENANQIGVQEDNIAALQAAIEEAEATLTDSNSEKQRVSKERAEADAHLTKTKADYQSTHSGNMDKRAEQLEGMRKIAIVRDQMGTHANPTITGLIRILKDRMGEENEELLGAMQTNREVYDGTVEVTTEQIQTLDGAMKELQEQIDGLVEQKAGATGDLETEKTNLATLKETKKALEADKEATIAEYNQEEAARVQTRKGLEEVITMFSDKEFKNIQEMKDTPMPEQKNDDVELTVEQVAQAEAAERTDEAAEESGTGVGLVDKALDLLNKQEEDSILTSFLQIASKSTVHQHQQAGADGPFDKVKDVITNTIARSEEALAKMTANQETCTADKAKAKIALETATAKVEKLKNRLDQQIAQKDDKSSQHSQRTNELAELFQTIKRITEVRDHKHKVNTAVEDETGDAVTLLDNALKVIKELPHAKNLASATVQIELLEGQYKDEHDGVVNAEIAQAKRFEDTMHDYKIEEAELNANIEHLHETVTMLASDISATNSDVKTADSLHDSSQKTLEAINKRCAEKSVTHEERQAKRQEQIAGFKEALKHLSQENGGAEDTL